MIGVYGGTFDPVHYGHLRTALEVRENLALRAVHFIPCRVPPHRRQPHFSARQRRRFLQLALADTPGFVLDTRELERPGPSFMVDTLASLRQEVGKEPLCLILGLDAFQGLPGWHRWRRLFDLAHIVVMDRPGYRADWRPPLREWVERLRTAEARELQRLPAGRIYFTRVTRLEISGTLIRQCLRQGRDPRYLLPDPVLDLIKRSYATESKHD